MNQQLTLDQLVNKYIHLGMLKEGEFLFPPLLALSLLDELESNNIIVGGITSWVHIVLNDGSIGIAEDLGNFFNISIVALDAVTTTTENVRLAKNHIKQVMNQVDYVSIDLILPLKWRFVDN